MKSRLINISNSSSFFLFGARGTGKSTLLRQHFSNYREGVLWFDLLDSETEQLFSRDPHRLEERVLAKRDSTRWVVIDEIQKVPKLLQHVHRLIESTQVLFALTGSSARRLKDEGADLLGGRAFTYSLHPLTQLEIGDTFSLDEALHFGALPKHFQFEKQEDKKLFLKSYAQNYVKEEVWSEHLIRKLEPFRRFLEVSAQANGKILNFSKIGRDVGVTSSVVQSYFEILEDTLVGYRLEPFHSSFRKRLVHQPKFYFFDLGVARAFARLLETNLVEQTTVFGEAFEHWVIVEAMRLSSYASNDYRFSFLKTKDDLEVDLVVERPGKRLLLIEIKSAREPDEVDIAKLSRIARDLGDVEAAIFCRTSMERLTKNVRVLPYLEGLKEFFPVQKSPTSAD